MKNTVCLTAVATVLTALATGNAFADTGTIAVAYQNGLTYTPIMVMEKNKLFEKQAAKLGITDAKATFIRMSGPGPIQDALLSDNVQFGSVGNSSLPLLFEKSHGNIKVAGNLSYMPLYLNTSNSNTKSLADYKDGSRIALPTIKTSVQAVTLQMAAAQAFGKDKYNVLDKYTISMAHPDAMVQMLSGQTEVTDHFTAPPFQYQELTDGKGKVRTLVNSYKVLGGKATFVLEVGNVKFVNANPKTYQAFVAALEESIQWINANKSEAAKFYIDFSKSKETLASVQAQLNDPEVEFNITPRGTMQYATFMRDVGVLKTVPASWRDMAFKNLWDKAGS